MAMSIAPVTSRKARRLTICVPVREETLAALLAGDSGAMESDPVLARMLGIVRGDPALGNFGLYDGVAEITLGWETFSPSRAARPTLGMAGEITRSPTVTLVTWISESASEAMVDSALATLFAAHPWEIPVIELTETTLLMRTRA